jgi:hypothetical protein
LTPSKAVLLEAASLELAARSTWAQVVATQLFGQFLFAVDDSLALLYLRLRRESAAALSHRLEKNDGLSASSRSMIHRPFVKG